MRAMSVSVGVGQFAMDSVDQCAELAGVDEECLALAVARRAARGDARPPRFAARQEPEADGDLCAVEELARQGDHAID